MVNREVSLVTLAHDAGEADALWFAQLSDRMTDEARVQWIREQGRGGFVVAMSHNVRDMGVRATGDLALAWQQGFESTMAWLGKGERL